MNQFWKLYSLFIRRLKTYLGLSYYNKPQPLGKVFRPREIAGFFNDLTAKTHWRGESDNEGIPVNVLADGRRIYFPICIVQKALGHWDKWLLTHNNADKEEFLKLCRWLLARQDERGGWFVWKQTGAPAITPYSALAQGECISAFVRAGELTGEPEFFQAARRAMHLMCTPVERGGTAIFENGDFFLEEIATIPRLTVLNGWIFALFGLYDLWLATGDNEAREFFNLGVETLKKHLYEYDAGFWTYYDVQGHLATVFYHDLHINQITAISLVDNSQIFAQYRDRWIAYQKSSLNRLTVLLREIVDMIKKLRKIQEVGEGAIVK
jgi:hypothetical protein